MKLSDVVELVGGALLTGGVIVVAGIGWALVMLGVMAIVAGFALGGDGR